MRNHMKSLLLTLSLASGASSAMAASKPVTVLFIGNSFTFGGHSAVWKYRADSVTDLNHDGVGGVPAVFETLTREAKLRYSVSLETSPGKTLQWHWTHKRAAIDQSWDRVVMQEYSTLDPQHPGNPATTVDYASRFAKLFKARNSSVNISLTATWSRPDKTYVKGGHWFGQPITAMASDLQHGIEAAAAAAGSVSVNRVGKAFDCAINAGVADPNPYDGIDYGKINLWAYDNHHASSEGYYLEALVIFVNITGHDPRSFGKDEIAASELGISPAMAVKLQEVAWNSAHAQRC